MSRNNWHWLAALCRLWAYVSVMPARRAAKLESLLTQASNQVWDVRWNDRAAYRARMNRPWGVK